MKNSNNVIEIYSKIVLGIFGFLYICGILISRLHLSQYGIFEFNLLRIQYILIGFTYVFYLIAFPLIFYSPFIIIKEVKSLFWKIMFILIILFFTTLTFSMLSGTLLGELGINSKIESLYEKTGYLYKAKPDSFLIIVSLGVLILSLIKSTFAGKNLIRSTLSKLQLIIMTCVFLFGLFYYAINIHPTVHYTFAGGKPIFAKIIIKEKNNIVQSLVEDNKIKDLDLNLIIHETKEFIYIFPMKTEEYFTCVAVSKREIEGIKYISFPAFSF